MKKIEKLFSRAIKKISEQVQMNRNKNEKIPNYRCYTH